MTVQTTTIPVSVNYTSRDYYALREDLIARVKDRLPNWSATDPADFGVALVEAFAYLGDLIAYYVDRNANENSIYTATQRNSLLNISQTYGYIPAGYRQAYVEVTFTNSSSSDVILPQGTIVSGQVVTNDVVQPVYFTTIADAPVAAGSNYTVGANEGQPVWQKDISADPNYGELIGTSNGAPGLSYLLGQNPVVDGSITLYVQDGDVYTRWNQVQHLIDYGPSDLVYTVSSDEFNNVYINFGDGVSGAIPVIYSAIRASYVVGGGIIGNITTSLVDTLVYVPGLSETQLTAIQGVISATNNIVAVGGADPESNDQIRYLAPGTLRAGNRAVTLKDFNDLATTVSGVGLANSVASTWTSVTIYIAPTRNDNDPDPQPGLDGNGDPTPEYNGLAANVATFLSDKVLIGTTVTINPPVYVDVLVTVAYSNRPQYTTAEVELAIKNTLLSVFGYTGLTFQQNITPQNIEYQLNQLPQIQTAQVTALSRYGSSGLTTLQGAANEIFRFQEANINIGSM